MVFWGQLIIAASFFVTGGMILAGALTLVWLVLLTAAMGLVFAFLVFVRIGLAWAVPVTILPEVTTGMILNAIALSLLVTLAVLSAIGEYVIRNFLMTQKYPAYIVREIHRKPVEE